MKRTRDLQEVQDMLARARDGADADAQRHRA
jgi:hypothetical protein